MEKIIVYGGGIVGLAIAYELAKTKSFKITVVEKYKIGSGASGAGTGILMNRGAQKFHSLFREAYVTSTGKLYPNWIAELTNHKNSKLSLNTVGDWTFFDTDKKWKSFLEQLDREECTSYELNKALPEHLQHLKSMVKGWAYFPEESYVDNQALLQALVVNLTELDVKIVEEAQCSFKGELNQPIINGEVFAADKAILSSGAWVDELLNEMGFTSKMVGVKGQLALCTGGPKISEIVHLNDHSYILPRDNYLMVGATTEARKWGTDFDEVGTDFIDEVLTKYFPSWEYQIVKSWAGIRPRSRDRLPLVGWVSDSVAICAGTYKNGICMAPLLANYVKTLFTQETPILDLSPWEPHRKKGLVRL